MISTASRRRPSQPEQTATADIKLKKTRNLVAQMTSAEWLASWPGTDAEKRLVADCMSCHTLERIARSNHTAEEWVQTIPRMLRYAQNTTPLAPQLRSGEPTGLLVQQPERLQAARGISRHRQPERVGHVPL